MPADVGVEQIEVGFVLSINELVALTHKLHVGPGHRLAPFLCKAFGGSTSLVDVGVQRVPREHAVRERGDACEAHLDVSATPNEAALLDDHAKHDPVAQVENLLWLDPVLL